MDVVEPDIQLFNESGIEIPIDLEFIKRTVSLIAQEESCSYSFLEIVYVDESSIIEINREYLERDYVTDIITFRYDEETSRRDIEGTLYCCSPRISEQAPEFSQDTESEFKRVLIHGLLHLCGYEDNTPKAKEKMTDKENYYLHKV